MKKIILLSLIAICTQAFAERWDGANNPNNMSRVAGASMITSFNDLPLQGQLADDRYAWSETYWPSNLGGVAYRWNHPNPQPFKYKTHSLAELRAMSQEQLAQLSPAELYDIAQGDYTYSFTKKVLGQFSTRDLWWEGICHGWAQAAANYPEPSAVVVTNKDGLRVPFGSSDVKGLMAMHEAYNFGGPGVNFGFVGKRCKVRGKVPGEEDPRDGELPKPTEEEMNSADCKDVNAGAFHVVIANMLAIHSRSFVADIDRLNDVWNQPIYGYSSQLLGEEPVDSSHTAYGVARRLRIATKFTYGEELQIWTPQKQAEHPEWIHWLSKSPVTGTEVQQFRHKAYEYIVELDAAGKIIGGEWLTGTRPDFMWIYGRSEKFKNARMPLAGLNAIYRPVKR